MEVRQRHLMLIFCNKIQTVNTVVEFLAKEFDMARHVIRSYQVQGLMRNDTMTLTGT